MRLFLKAVLITFFSLSCYAESVSQYISNLIPGEGDTEVSIDIRDNHKPDYSILAVREIEKTETGNYFTQFSLFKSLEPANSVSSSNKIDFCSSVKFGFIFFDIIYKYLAQD